MQRRIWRQHRPHFDSCRRAASVAALPQFSSGLPFRSFLISFALTWVHLHVLPQNYRLLFGGASRRIPLVHPTKKVAHIFKYVLLPVFSGRLSWIHILRVENREKLATDELKEPPIYVLRRKSHPLFYLSRVCVHVMIVKSCTSGHSVSCVGWLAIALRALRGQNCHWTSIMV